ncbi:MAG TPA: tRNA (adenosine(37)-N6)-threonylcarbamoyltransferase complex dimerization subunit type 1 TsaB [bacterium]|nr:tRNA (adenosine(37)-N6)-threonylcarbamoyltransferase complex dimerization subunit type 1 TsaB [bacterium]
MRVLGFETATPYGSVAVVGTEGLRAEMTALVPMRHLEWLMPAVEHLLTEAEIRREEIEGLAVSVGPGGFTGLRIAIATAAAWARAAGIPVIGISTLEGLAATVAGPGLIAPLLDAKRGEVAAALFRREEDLTLTRLHDDIVLPPDRLGEVVPADEPALLLGDGLARWGEAIREALPAARHGPPAAWVPRAAVVAALGRERLLGGWSDDPYRLAPHYGRSPAVATME